MVDRYHIIIDYWFEGVQDKDAVDKKKNPFKKWFANNKKLDEDICLKFEADLIKVGNGKYDDWEHCTRGRLGLILLCDQFSRNIFRGTPRMYAFDDIALKNAQAMIADEQDANCPLIERIFIYMPLMHCEDIILQNLSVGKFKELVAAAEEVCPHNMSYFEGQLQHAYKFHNIIKEFGRFPHRNEILQRLSTPEEEAFLQKKS